MDTAKQRNAPAAPDRDEANPEPEVMGPPDPESSQPDIMEPPEAPIKES